MGKVVLFAEPKIEPVRPLFPSSALARGAARSELDRLSINAANLDTDILEQAAAVAAVFGMPDLARMNADEVLAELTELVKRPDVCAVLEAYNRSPNRRWAR
jgi:hypothetical protein